MLPDSEIVTKILKFSVYSCASDEEIEIVYEYVTASSSDDEATSSPPAKKSAPVIEEKKKPSPTLPKKNNNSFKPLNSHRGFSGPSEPSSGTASSKARMWLKFENDVKPKFPQSSRISRF